MKRKNSTIAKFDMGLAEIFVRIYKIAWKQEASRTGTKASLLYKLYIYCVCKLETLHDCLFKIMQLFKN